MLCPWGGVDPEVAPGGLPPVDVAGGTYLEGGANVPPECLLENGGAISRRPHARQEVVPCAPAGP